MDQVIYPGETLKITKLLQQAENKGVDPGQSQTRWIFKSCNFSYELSCEGNATEIIERPYRKQLSISSKSRLHTQKGESLRQERPSHSPTLRCWLARQPLTRVRGLIVTQMPER
jgi:hypothetical protein